MQKKQKVKIKYCSEIMPTKNKKGGQAAVLWEPELRISKFLWKCCQKLDVALIILLQNMI